MKKIIISLISIVFILTFLILGVYYVKFRQSTAPVKAEGVELLFVSNQTSFKQGDEFNVDIYLDSKGMSVTGADLKIKYDANQLLALSITPGNFLPVVFIPGQITSGQAKIVLGCNPTDPKNGNGILATIKFKVLGQGTNTSIYFDSTTAVAALGQTTNVLGTPPTFDINIEPESTPTDGVKIGDVNGDGFVNILDIGVVVNNYGTTGTLGFIPADINNDGAVNILDIGIIINNYGNAQN